MDRILIIDFGSQVTQLIARRVRESGVYCEIVPFQSASEKCTGINKTLDFITGKINIYNQDKYSNNWFKVHNLLNKKSFFNSKKKIVTLVCIKRLK